MTRPHLAQVAFLLTVAAALMVGLDGLDPVPAKAGRGYGGGGYKPCRKACQVKGCRKNCKKAKRTCLYCTKQDLKPVKASCRGDADARTCRSTVKSLLRTRLQACKGATGSCGQCCRNDYSGSCTSAFSGTSGFGSYFRTVKNYGRVKRYKPDCDGYAGARVVTDSCRAGCERARAAGLRACGKGRCDVTVIETRHQACLDECAGASPSGTSSGR
jgi:hypothetical protein